MTQEFPVIYEWAGKNFSGYSPDVKGCFATAKTLKQMRSTLKTALEAHLQWMTNEGDAMPSPSDTVTVDMEPDKEFPQPQGYYVVVERLKIRMPKPKSLKEKSAGSKRPGAKRGELQAA